MRSLQINIIVKLQLCFFYISTRIVNKRLKTQTLIWIVLSNIVNDFRFYRSMLPWLDHKRFYANRNETWVEQEQWTVTNGQGEKVKVCQFANFVAWQKQWPNKQMRGFFEEQLKKIYIFFRNSGSAWIKKL